MKPLAGLLGAAFLAVALFVSATAAAAAAEDDEYAVDAQGRRMRVAFDPGHRVHLGGAWAPVAQSPSLVSTGRFALSGGLSVRQRVDFDDEAIRWKLDHEIASGSATFGARSSVVGELYSLRFLRWSEDGGLVLPTTPPRRLGFPLGLGFDVGLGSVDLLTDGGVRGEVGVARGALLFDFVRSRTHGAFVTLGVGPRYSLHVDAKTGRVEHIVVPFSEPELAARLELGRGHHVLAARAGGGYAWTSDSGAGAQARASASYELVFAAVNDQPLALRSEGSFRYDDPPVPGRGPAEVRGSLGLVLGLPLPGSPRKP